jgi:hypothetical protein
MDNNKRRLLNGLFMFFNLVGEVKPIRVFLDGYDIDEIENNVFRKTKLPKVFEDFLLDLVEETNEERIEFISNEDGSTIMEGIDTGNYDMAYNEVIFDFDTREKKMTLRTMANYDDGFEDTTSVTTPEMLRMVMKDSNCTEILINFWGRDGHYEFDISDSEDDCDGNILPGIGSGTFREMLNHIYDDKWKNGDGSTGKIKITLEDITTFIRFLDSNVSYSEYVREFTL